MRYTINLGNGTGRYAEIVGSVELQLHHDYKPGVDGPTVPKLREIVRRELSHRTRNHKLLTFL